MELAAALLIGLAGSLHCIGMCGPIALALPVQNSSAAFYTGRILYNAGRIISYSLMGLLFGLLGSKIILAGFQQGLSIFLGVFILLFIFLPAKYKNYFTGYSIIAKVVSSLKTVIGNLFKKKSLPAIFFIGFLNGFLPCGLVYIAVAGAAAAGSAFSGMIFMAAFGLGTSPAMFAASLFGKFISLNIRQKIRKLVPVFAVMLAVIFILRGLNLGIPMLSPKLSTEKAVEVECH